MKQRIKLLITAALVVAFAALGLISPLATSLVTAAPVVPGDAAKNGLNAAGGGGPNPMAESAGQERRERPVVYTRGHCGHHDRAGGYSVHPFKRRRITNQRGKRHHPVLNRWARRRATCLCDCQLRDQSVLVITLTNRDKSAITYASTIVRRKESTRMKNILQKSLQALLLVPVIALGVAPCRAWPCSCNRYQQRRKCSEG